MTKIGVYGTLKKGEGNSYLLENSEYLGKKVLYNVGITDRPGFPFAYKVDGYRTTVEVYDVDEITLKSIDSLEGHPDWYKREEIEGIWVYLNESHGRGYPLLKENGEW